LVSVAVAAAVMGVVHAAIIPNRVMVVNSHSKSAGLNSPTLIDTMISLMATTITRIKAAWAA